jgi:hypothetical protein
MRYVAAAGGGSSALPTSGTRPVVLVSRSTVADRRPDQMMTRVVAAATGAELDVVLATGPCTRG